MVASKDGPRGRTDVLDQHIILYPRVPPIYAPCVDFHFHNEK